jgi:hypothetical protein
LKSNYDYVRIIDRNEWFCACLRGRSGIFPRTHFLCNNVKKALFSGVYSMATHGYAIVLSNSSEICDNCDNCVWRTFLILIIYTGSWILLKRPRWTLLTKSKQNQVLMGIMSAINSVYILNTHWFVWRGQFSYIKSILTIYQMSNIQSTPIQKNDIFALATLPLLNE